jgi:asparagine synthase (glutamine-hydrolysing)
MCGIFGFISIDGNIINDSLLQVLSDSMIYRGPDDEGIINKGSWAIGMRRLSIIDISGGHQPISNNNIHLVANGEIYNYKELRKDLIKLGYEFKTKSDVEVILHLYSEYGLDAIHHLNGMFAFAIYDENEEILWLARDRLGIKPLYYGWKHDNLIFSSELTGLAKYLNAQVLKESILDYLGYSYIPAPNTIFEGISKLNPGEEMIISNGSVKNNIYWKPNITSSYKGNVNDAARYLDKLLKESVELQLISDVPLGVFLSGGVDSSAIASYAAKINPNIPLETYTIDFSDKEGEDAAFAEEVSKLLGTNHHSIKVDADQQFKSLDELIPIMDEPMSDSAIVPTYMLSKLAREHGIKVLLSGAGGDEIFGGYPRYFPDKIFSAGWFSSLPKPMRYLSAFLLGFINPNHRIRLLKPARNFITNISGVNFQFLSQCISSKDDFDALLKRIDKDYKRTSSKNLYELMNIDVKDYLPNNVLSLTDKATMAASVECRVPLLDHRVVEFAFSLKKEINILDGEQKGLFKKVLTNLLPKKLLWRKKEGFNAPINLWVENWPDKIRKELIENLSPDLQGLIECSTIDKWLSTSKQRSQAGASIYALFVLNKWLNNFHTK